MRTLHLVWITAALAGTALATPALARSHGRTHTDQQSPTAPAKRHARPNGTHRHKGTKSPTGDANDQDLILVPVLNGRPNPNNDEAMDSDDGTDEGPPPANDITLQYAIVVMVPSADTYEPVFSNPT